jgi:Transcriptional regulators
MSRQSKNLTDQTADNIFQMIIADPGLQPDMKLPNEADLCALLNVSRTTIREAIRILSAQGFVEVRRGLGTFVTSQANIRKDIGLSSLESIHIRLRDLFEIRMMFEPETAMLACMRATEEELQTIIKNADEVARQIGKNGEWEKADLVFHHSIVSASHNQFAEQLMPIINKAINDTWRMYSTAPQLPEIVIQDNNTIVNFLKIRDHLGVKFALSTHIRHIIDITTIN